MTIWPFPFTPLLLLPPAPLLYAGYCFLLLGTRPVEAALGSVVYSSERVISLFCICIQAPPKIKPIKRNLVLSNQPERNSFPNGEFCSSAGGREEKGRTCYVWADGRMVVRSGRRRHPGIRNYVSHSFSFPTRRSSAIAPRVQRTGGRTRTRAEGSHLFWCSSS